MEKNVWDIAQAKFEENPEAVTLDYLIELALSEEEREEC